MVGQIRFQWWREVVEGQRDSEAQSHPLASQLLELVRSGILSGEMLTRKIEAHVFDLYHDPMPDTETFEAWCGETRSVLFQQLAAQNNSVEGALADVCGHAGVAFGYADVLSDLPMHCVAGRRFLPGDLLQTNGLSDEQWFSSDNPVRSDVAKAAAHVGIGHVEKALTALQSCDPALRPLFAPLSPVKFMLEMASKAGGDAFVTPVRLGQLRLQWLLFRGI